MEYFLDTAAAVKFYASAEAGHRAVVQLVQGHGRPLWVGAWTIVEFAGAMARNVRERAITEAVSRTIFATFLADLGGTFRVDPLEGARLVRAIEFLGSIGARCWLRSGDAVILAHADAIRESNGWTRQDLAVVTNDRHLLEAAAHAGFGTMNPEA